jgi:cytochrome c2
MKRFLKIIGMLVLAFIFIACIAAGYVHFSGIPSYETQKINLVVEPTPERVERGQKMASALCIECHMGEDGKLSGKKLLDVPTEFGEIYSRNITQHPEIGIGNWSDGELYYLLRTGIKKDGQYIPPYMVKFPNAADQDLYDIIAWLRSDKLALQPSEKEAPETKTSLLTKFLCRVAFKPLPLPNKVIVRPDTNDLLGLGSYLVNDIYHCADCHSADFKTNNEMNPSLSVGYLGGGNPLLNLKGEVIKSSNITFDETGLAAYSLDDFKTVMLTGKRKNGEQLRYPMIPYAHFSSKELEAIYAFLQTVPKLKSKN